MDILEIGMMSLFFFSQYMTCLSIVAVGHDCNPILFQGKGGWHFVKKLDGGREDAVETGSSAFKFFQQIVDKGEATIETKLTTKHQNSIT